MDTVRCAVITGASSGIGAAISRRLAREGMAVVLAARREDRLHTLAEEIAAGGGRADVVRCDVTSRTEAEALIHQAVARYHRLDILINNAGRGHFSSVEDTPDAVVRSMFELNVFALWNTVRPALRQMTLQKSGHIINMGSLAGKIGFGYNAAYVAAKHAVVGFTRALRMELVETGVHASVVCPHGVQTDWADATEGGPMTRFFSEAGPLAREIASARGIRPPEMEGVITPERVAEAVMECIRNPVAEVYTHAGSLEFVRLAATDPAESERRLLPGALAEQIVYRKARDRSEIP